ncbi:hypothetical protein [Spirosoma sordidisoli]|uniref:hypothetical protein n=1 Tax=Spirosoma sordidisoli TaxID=2502893 RepID=UPI0013EA1524|nr:hypothetical protein [Spirosoma sordidisoli]
MQTDLTLCLANNDKCPLRRSCRRYTELVKLDPAECHIFSKIDGQTCAEADYPNDYPEYLPL